jgi:Integrase core domain
MGCAEGLAVEAIKTVPHVPLSHPFVERLIGTIRRECLDRTLFWSAADLDVKLRDFQRYLPSTESIQRRGPGDTIPGSIRRVV